ncbi:MAG: outer membrane lipoprotein carrier protein LolA [Calditrichaeota bacterium]|nr:MAG: outer membrane lipoprotein carrier protein LolA [Calditrichota bacterium]
MNNLIYQTLYTLKNKMEYVMKCLLVSVLFLLPVLLSAQDVEDIIEDVQERYEDMENFSALFKRVETFQLTGTVSETVGKVWVKDGTKYRFESDDQQIVTDGKTVWSYNALNKQVIVDRVRTESGALLPRDMLFKYPREYLSTLLRTEKQNGNDLFVIKLTPRGKVTGVIKSMKIWVEDDRWLIKKIETTDLNGNRTAFEISHIDTEHPIPDKKFVFEAKPGVRVVDLR